MQPSALPIDFVQGQKMAAQGSSGQAVAESVCVQTMSSWLTLVRDFEELEKGEGAKAAIEKGQKTCSYVARQDGSDYPGA